MATNNALDLNQRAAIGSTYGNAVTHEGSYTTATLANGDICQLVRIPAGTRIQDVTIQHDQIDSNGAPTLTAKVGYTPVNATDGPAVQDAYWLASVAFGRTKARVDMAAQPITFDFDVYLIVTITAAIATLVTAAKMTAIAKGFYVGTK